MALVVSPVVRNAADKWSLSVKVYCAIALHISPASIERTPMPHITVAVAHRLTTSQARRRLQAALTQLRHEAALRSLEAHWQGNTLNVTLSLFGMTVSGQAIVEPHQVRLEIDLPWYLAPLTATLTDEIENVGGALLQARGEASFLLG
jgi:putative polyhydroxyalkanoate system protein